MAGTCQIARQKLTRYIERIRAGGAAEKVGTAVKASYIGGVSTPLKGIVGNVSWGGFRALAQQPAEAAVDYLASVARSARTGFTVSPNEFREVVNAFDLGGMRAYREGMQRGAKTVTDAVAAGKRSWSGLKPGTPFGQRIAAFMDDFSAVLNADASKLNINTPAAVNIQSPWLRGLTEAAFGAAEAVDRPFFEGSLSMSMYMQAKLSAVRQNLRGAAREAEISRLVANPTDDMVMRAFDDALYATFKDTPQMVQAMERGRSALRRLADEADTPRKRAGAMATSVFADITMPFTGVPSSIAKKSVELSPLGLVGTVTGTQAQRARSVASAGLGTAMIVLGAELARDGKLVAGASNSRNERADDLATRQFYSVKIGDQWVDIRSLGPLAVPLFVGATMQRTAEKNPEASPLSLSATGLATAGKSVVDNSFAQGIKRTIDAVEEPERRGAAFAAGLVPIPSVVGQASRAMDPKEREARTFTERLMSRTPARMLLDEQLTPMGPAPEKTLGERLAPFSPMPTSPDRDSPAMREVRRLGLAIGLPERTTTVKGKRVELTRDQYEQMVTSQGATALPDVERLMAMPGYDSLPDEEKKRRMRIVIERARNRARQPVRREAALLLGVP